MEEENKKTKGREERKHSGGKAREQREVRLKYEDTMRGGEKEKKEMKLREE